MAAINLDEGTGWQSVGLFHAVRMDPVAGVHHDTLKERVGRRIGLALRGVVLFGLGSAAAVLVVLFVMAMARL